MDILFQNPFLSHELEALIETRPAIQLLVDSLKKSDEFTGLQIIDLKGTLPAIDFVQRIQKVIPNRDRRKQLHFESDVEQDKLVFKDFVIQKWYDNVKGKLAGVPVTLEAFSQSVDIQPVALEPVVPMHELDRLLHAQREKGVKEYLQFINVVNGQVTIDKNAESILTQRFTVYASESQQAFINDLHNVLTLLNDVEKKYALPGVCYLGITQGEKGYQFNPKILYK